MSRFFVFAPIGVAFEEVYTFCSLGLCYAVIAALCISLQSLNTTSLVFLILNVQQSLFIFGMIQQGRLPSPQLYKVHNSKFIGFCKTQRHGNFISKDLNVSPLITIVVYCD